MSKPEPVTTCSTCIHWDTNGEFYNEVLQAKRCKKIQHSEDATEWNDEYDRVAKKEFADDKAFACDGSGHHACLITKPDFFCAHWEAKP